MQTKVAYIAIFLVLLVIIDRDHHRTGWGSGRKGTRGQEQQSRPRPPLLSSASAVADKMAAADGVDVYTVYVGRLPVGVTEGELINLFDSDGDVAGVRVCGSKCDKDYSFGFVVFHSLEKAEKAIKEKHKIRYKGRSLIVEMSEQTRDAIVNGVEHGSNWRRIRNAPMAETLYLKKFKELCQDFCSKSNSDLDPDEFLREVKMTKFGAYGPQKSQIIDDESISWENIIKDTLKDSCSTSRSLGCRAGS